MGCHCKIPHIIKKGKYKAVQLYQCKCCGRKFRQQYTIRRITAVDKQYIIHLHNRGNSTRSISFLSHFSHVGIIKALTRFAINIAPPRLKKHKSYQVDEMKTFIAKKKKTPCSSKKEEYWIAYAIENGTGQPCALATGWSREKTMVAPMIKELVKSKPRKIYTDGLNLYPSLIPKKIHRVFERCTNKIERHNLTLRTHIQRLTRKTLCFSRSPKMLETSLKIYFWG